MEVSPKQADREGFLFFVKNFLRELKKVRKKINFSEEVVANQ